jgi:hypothetical protein
MRRLVAITVFCLAAAPARGETLIIAPDPCPAPADAAPYVAPWDIEATDLNPDRAAADHVIILYDAPLRGWASRRLFTRFVIGAAAYAFAAERQSCSGY